MNTEYKCQLVLENKGSLTLEGSLFEIYYVLEILIRPGSNHKWGNLFKIPSLEAIVNGLKEDLSWFETLIPEGCYCYTYDENEKMKLCPFWSKKENGEPQNDGYCSFLKQGDWEIGGSSLLWDQVKECWVD